MSLNLSSNRQQSRSTSVRTELEDLDNEKTHLSSLLTQLNIQTDSIKYNYHQNFKSLSILSSNPMNTRVFIENNHPSTFDIHQRTNSQLNKRTNLSKYGRSDNNNQHCNHQIRRKKNKHVEQNENNDFHYQNTITVRQISCKEKKKKIFINRDKQKLRKSSSPLKSDNLLSQSNISLSRDSSATSSPGSSQVLPIVYNETRPIGINKHLRSILNLSNTLQVQTSKYENIRHLVDELKSCITKLGDLFDKEKTRRSSSRRKSRKKKNHLLFDDINVQRRCHSIFPQDQLKRCLLVYQRKRNSSQTRKEKK